MYVRIIAVRLECELLDRRKFKTKAEARVACFEFIEGWYNHSRRHSALGYKSPINYERTTTKGLEYLSPLPSTKPGELQVHIAETCCRCLLRRNTL